MQGRYQVVVAVLSLVVNRRMALDDALTIACGEGALKLVKVQRAGGKAMDAADLLKGFAVPRGTMFG